MKGSTAEISFSSNSEPWGRYGLQRNWPVCESVCAVVKQIDREHKASECGLVRLVQVFQACCTWWCEPLQSHILCVVGGFGSFPALSRGASLKRRINELVNRHRMVVQKRSMIYEMRRLALTSFILSAVEVSLTFCSTITKLLTSSFFSFFLMHLFHICSQDATFKIK